MKRKSKQSKLTVLLIGLISLVILMISTGFYLEQLKADNITYELDAKIFDPAVTANDASFDYNLAGGVVPHHLLAKDIIDGFWGRLGLINGHDTIVLLSPDHYQNGLFSEDNRFISLSLYTRNYHDLEVDYPLLLKLDSQFQFDKKTAYVSLDHGISNHLPYIKKYLPDVKILPVLIPAEITQEQIEELTRYLARNISNRSIVVSSVDFSHYLPKNAALFHDVKSLNTFIDFKESEFESLEVDCWQCLYGTRLFSRLRNKENIDHLIHLDSTDFSKELDPLETTTYISLILKKQDMPKDNEFKAKTLLFTGDIMLDRGVEALMKKNSFYYPFEKINRLFHGVDMVVGNLEGPIVKSPPAYADDSLRFAFDPQVIDGLLFNQFDVLSLANNHTKNMGETGLKQTREYLLKENIQPIGDPILCSDDFVYEKDDIIYLAFNNTHKSICPPNEILKFVKKTRKENEGKFIIANMHWGREYKKVNSDKQQQMAHRLIDAGIDLIIGHHAHVVANIEQYKNKLIFYSLGNFVFDQYFSENVQSGLVVGVELYKTRVVYRIFPIKSVISQPSLMSKKDSIGFLDELAKSSSKELQDEIKNAIIEISLTK